MNWMIALGWGLLTCTHPNLHEVLTPQDDYIAESPKAEKATVKGQVLGSDNKPVAYIQIILLDHNYEELTTTETDQEGKYSFENILEIGHTYYININTEIEVEGKLFRKIKPIDDKDIEVDFSMAMTYTVSIDTIMTYDPEAFDELYETVRNEDIEVGEYANREYENIELAVPPITTEIDEGMVLTSDNTFSTFSIDVDKASYSLLKAHLDKGYPCDIENLRIEEMVNYFHYDYPNPEDNVPFATHTTFTDCPWNPNAQLLHIGVQGNRMEFVQGPPTNMVFLLDVSGSMSEDLELVKSSIKLIVDQMRPQDKISIVVYAGAAGLVLSPTSGDKKDVILNALDDLQAGGSTAGGEGIQLAYKVAQENFVEGGNNRVVLATDGDFNVGLSSDEELEELIEKEREKGIFLTALGFGYGNYEDTKMETLADKGNGVYAYIADQATANKILVEEAGAALITIAKDVKVQLEFNDNLVKAYRLIGYDNRRLNKEDFEDDTKDAGELGAGHSVTAIYEVVYHKPIHKLKPRHQMLTINLRHKAPDADESTLIQNDIKYNYQPLEEGTEDMRWSIAIAQWSLMIRGEDYVANTNFDDLKNLATSGVGIDENGERKECLLWMDVWNAEYNTVE